MIGGGVCVEVNDVWGVLGCWHVCVMAAVT